MRLSSASFFSFWILKAACFSTSSYSCLRWAASLSSSSFSSCCCSRSYLDSLALFKRSSSASYLFFLKNSDRAALCSMSFCLKKKASSSCLRFNSSSLSLDDFWACSFCSFSNCFWARICWSCSRLSSTSFFSRDSSSASYFVEISYYLILKASFSAFIKSYLAWPSICCCLWNSYSLASLAIWSSFAWCSTSILFSSSSLSLYCWSSKSALALASNIFLFSKSISFCLSASSSFDFRFYSISSNSLLTFRSHSSYSFCL